jgi:hypothetical protein
VCSIARAIGTEDEVRGTWRRRTLAFGLVGAFLLAGCSGPPGPRETITPTVIADKTAPPDPSVPSVWPLTGIAGEVVVRPAIAVKIENTAESRPQTGVEDADVVWENIVEFGVPRWVAVYHSTLPAEVGPIRSVRPADARILSPLRGLVAFSGGQPGILSLMRRTPLQLLSEDDGDEGFTRSRSRRAPHNVYGSLETFLGQADQDHLRPPDPQFEFARPGRSAAELAGSPTERIDQTLAPPVTPSWTWDVGTGRWLRSENGRPALSADDVRLSATNVVVISVVSFDSGFDAQQGRAVPDLRLEGEGEALVATGGKTREVTWSKAERDEPLVLTGPDGEVARLAPGNTWVELVPRGTGSYSVT